jgi:hypothetical protein
MQIWRYPTVPPLTKGRNDAGETSEKGEKGVKAHLCFAEPQSRLGFISRPLRGGRNDPNR